MKKVAGATFVDSSLRDLKKKGNLCNAPDIYNPDKFFQKVIHFTPYEKDMELQPYFNEWHIELYGYGLRKKRPHTLFTCFIKIYNKMKREKVSLVRGGLPYLGSLYGCLAAKALGIPSVVSLGGDNRLAQDLTGVYHYKWRFLTNGLEHMVLSICDSIIVPNRFTAKYVEGIIGRNAASKKTHVIPWQCQEISDDDSGDEGILSEFGLAREDVVVPIVGFINEYKFSDILFETFNNWKPAAGGKVKFLFVGDGPLKDKGEKLFAKRTDIDFLGWQPREVIHALLRSARFVLIPMSGHVLLEAASLGKLVITSHLEWHSELVENGETGILVDPNQSEQWRQAIDRALALSIDAGKMPAKLKKKFIAHYSPRKAKEMVCDLYRSLIEA